MRLKSTGVECPAGISDGVGYQVVIHPDTGLADMDGQGFRIEPEVPDGDSAALLPASGRGLPARHRGYRGQENCKRNEITEGAMEGHICGASTGYVAHVAG